MRRTIIAVLFLPTLSFAGISITPGSGYISIVPGSGNLSVAPPVSGADAIALDTSTYLAPGSNGQFPSWNINIGNGNAGTDKVVFLMTQTNNATVTVTSATIGGVNSANAFTKIGRNVDGGNTTTQELWYFVNPPTSVQSVQIDFSGSPTGSQGQAVDLVGVSQSTVWESSGAIANSGSPASVSMKVTTANDWMLDSWWMNAIAGAPTPTGGQTVSFSGQIFGSAAGFSYAGPESTGNYSDSYTFASGGMDACAAMIKPGP